LAAAPGLADSECKVFWLDSPAAPEPLRPLAGEERCQLAVVGGGFTGLWAALLAAESGADVVLLEGDRCGAGASGRNGGFLEASLTHGLENALSCWADEIDRLLEGIRFTHRWAGAIDTCSRFCVTFGRALGGRVAYAVGYTGLGVGASRFGALVALDLVQGRESELTRLELVRSRPIRSAARSGGHPPALARADERGGRRGAWLRLLDRVGAGFDS
jgi:glycine/D-amino acid oxidase-like deaminating enzyme